MDAELLSLLKAEIAAILPEMIALRRALHREPELACAEHATRAKIVAALAGEALTIRAPLLGTDVIAEFGQGERLIALRADIDAVNTTEQTGLPYASIHDEVMHACGHDGHTTMLVGATKALARLGARLPHRVRCIFQPGEEIRAAGRDLVQLGACDGADEAYALHGWAGIPAGSITSRAGAQMAAASFFTITVTGKGCHGAQPERGLNPIPIAARLALRLQAEHERLRDRDGSLISVCAVTGGTVGNVIPDQVTMRGTCRYLRADLADDMAAVLRTACETIAAETGSAIELDYQRSYEIPTVNTEAGYAKAKAVTAIVSGNFIEMPAPSMGSEDFSYYLVNREGAMLFLGQGETSSNLHSATFDFNDDTLAAGILTYCLLAV